MAEISARKQYEFHNVGNQYYAVLSGESGNNSSRVQIIDSLQL